MKNTVVDAFHLLWYRSPNTHKQNTYFGYPIDQWPLDMWLYQELICSEKPEFILQTG